MGLSENEKTLPVLSPSKSENETFHQEQLISIFRMCILILFYWKISFKKKMDN